MRLAAYLIIVLSKSLCTVSLHVTCGLLMNDTQAAVLCRRNIFADLLRKRFGRHFCTLCARTTDLEEETNEPTLCGVLRRCPGPDIVPAFSSEKDHLIKRRLRNECGCLASI